MTARITRHFLRNAVALLLVASSAHASATLEIVGPGFPSGISADGSVVTGTLPGSYEVFRWTRADGMVPLGMCSGCVLGRVGGFPQVSEDGTVVSGTILTSDSLYMTMGIWRLGTGWQPFVPPVPADGGLLDDSYGSAWALSGDGLAVGGYYWRPGQPGGLAHAFRWTDAGGLVDLGSSGHSSRVSGANHDGSVMAGWDEGEDGHWRATVWVNGALTTLTESMGFTEAHAVTPDGSIVAGMDYDDVKFKGVAALWTWNGLSWVRTLIGVLPGTFAHYGEAHALDVTANGRTVVGYNQYDNVSSAGFLWTAGTGMVEATQFLAEQGITLPGDFVLTTLTGISDDGRTIMGAGQQVFFPFAQKWVLIHLDEALGVEEGTPPVALRLGAFPNPVRGSASVAFTLPEPGAAELAVFDVGGRRTRTLASGERIAGEHVVRWDGRDERGAPAAAGVYYLRLRSGAHTASSRIVVVK